MYIIGLESNKFGPVAGTPYIFAEILSNLDHGGMQVFNGLCMGDPFLLLDCPEICTMQVHFTSVHIKLGYADFSSPDDSSPDCSSRTVRPSGCSSHGLFVPRTIGYIAIAENDACFIAMEIAMEVMVTTKVITVSKSPPEY